MPISPVRVLLLAALVTLLAGPRSATAERLKVCAFRFQSPHEMEVFSSRLPEKDFEIVDLSPPPLLGQDTSVSGGGG